MVNVSVCVDTQVLEEVIEGVYVLHYRITSHLKESSRLLVENLI